MFVRRIKKAINPEDLKLKTLADFGYEFELDGIRHPERGAVDREVIKMLEKDFSLKSIRIPINSTENDPSCLIYHTPGANTKENLVVIATSYSSGPGLWNSASVAIHGFLNGSIAFLINGLTELGYGVLILNPNENFWSPSGRAVTTNDYSQENIEIPSSDCLDSHLKYTWNNVLK
ncbi:hypothetical protein AYI70_g6393 [Smittium culicis]|uniref:Arb2 domain-containing protein n=2 Tax=Smittium culicis TaxID=133412 RepID=A0A1R1XQ85_9FUNG|nr:hypothetical protein AYI70_g6393 [Smittium culicis]